MNKTQKVIVVLLILAIVFSAVSIIISLSVREYNLPKTNLGGQGQINLVVEQNPNIKEETRG